MSSDTAKALNETQLNEWKHALAKFFPSLYALLHEQDANDAVSLTKEKPQEIFDREKEHYLSSISDYIIAREAALREQDWARLKELEFMNAMDQSWFFHQRDHYEDYLQKVKDAGGKMIDLDLYGDLLTLAMRFCESVLEPIRDAQIEQSSADRKKISALSDEIALELIELSSGCATLCKTERESAIDNFIEKCGAALTTAFETPRQNSRTITTFPPIVEQYLKTTFYNAARSVEDLVKTFAQHIPMSKEDRKACVGVLVDVAEGWMQRPDVLEVNAIHQVCNTVEPFITALEEIDREEAEAVATLSQAIKKLRQMVFSDQPSLELR